MAADQYEVESGVYECPGCGVRYDQDDYERAGGAGRALGAHMRACDELDEDEDIDRDGDPFAKLSDGEPTSRSVNALRDEG